MGRQRTAGSIDFRATAAGRMNRVLGVAAGVRPRAVDKQDARRDNCGRCATRYGVIAGRSFVADVIEPNGIDCAII